MYLLDIVSIVSASQGLGWIGGHSPVNCSEGSTMIENSLNPDPCFETRHVILSEYIKAERRVSTKSINLICPVQALTHLFDTVHSDWLWIMAASRPTFDTSRTQSSISASAWGVRPPSPSVSRQSTLPGKKIGQS